MMGPAPARRSMARVCHKDTLLLDARRGHQLPIHEPGACRCMYFVVAAYDYLGRLSAFSNVVVKPSDLRYLYMPMMKR